MSNEIQGGATVHRVTVEKLHIKLETPITNKSWQKVAAALSLLPESVPLTIGVKEETGELFITAEHTAEGVDKVL